MMTCDTSVQRHPAELILYLTHYLRLIQAKAWMGQPGTFPVPCHNLILTRRVQQVPGNRAQHPKPAPETFGSCRAGC